MLIARQWLSECHVGMDICHLRSRRRIEEVYWRLREAVVWHHQRGSFIERSLIGHICLLFGLLRKSGGD